MSEVISSKVEMNSSLKMRAGTDAQLIAAVREHCVLYDSTHARYVDKLHKASVWKEIGQQLKAHPIACKARWNNIRDIYRKSLRKRPKRARRYKYADQLTFMKKFLKGNEDSDEAEVNDDEDEEETKESSNSAAEDIEHDATSDYEFFDKKQSVGTVTSFPVYPASMHAVDVFLAGLSPTLKDMSPYHLSLAKSEIFATVHKYEMKGIMDDGGWRRNVDPLPSKFEETE